MQFLIEVQTSEQRYSTIKCSFAQQQSSLPCNGKVFQLVLHEVPKQIVVVHSVSYTIHILQTSHVQGADICFLFVDRFYYYHSILANSLVLLGTALTTVPTSYIFKVVIQTSKITLFGILAPSEFVRFSIISKIICELLGFL